MSATKKSKTSNGSSQFERLNNDHLDFTKLSDDHQFLLPNDILLSRLGIVFLLTKKIIGLQSFSEIYEERGSKYFHAAFIIARQKLGLNPISAAKCIVINRWLSEQEKNPGGFAQHLEKIFDALKQRMSKDELDSWDENQLYFQKKIWQEQQTQRRLRFVRPHQPNLIVSILTLQHMTSKLFKELIEQSKNNQAFRKQEGEKRLKNIIENSFMIVAQPTSSKGQPVTQYTKRRDKTPKEHIAELNVRVISLLDSQCRNLGLELSSIKVTVYLSDHSANNSGEEQTPIEWKSREILCSKGRLSSFLYFELNSITLKQLDPNRELPLYNSHLCRCKFNFTWAVPHLNLSSNQTIVSEPFAIVSHPSHFPDWTSRIFLEELKRNSDDSIQTLLNLIFDHHTLVTGVQPNQFTRDYLEKVVQQTTRYPSSEDGQFDCVQKMLAKIISQIETFHTYPFLSLMYSEGLFLGICDNEIDNQLSGTKEDPHMLLRFQGLATQNPQKETGIRHILHNGQLMQSTFEKNSFIVQIFGLVLESNSPNTAHVRIYSPTPNVLVQNLRFYYHERLSQITEFDSNKYKPIIPCLPERSPSHSNTTSSDSNDGFLDDLFPESQSDEMSGDYQIQFMDSENPPGKVGIKLLVSNRVARDREALTCSLMRALEEFIWLKLNNSDNEVME